MNKNRFPIALPLILLLATTAAAGEPPLIGLPGAAPTTPAMAALPAAEPRDSVQEEAPAPKRAAVPAFSRDLYKEDRHFPRYPQQKPVVAFWKRVFGEYSDTQSVIHCGAYPQIVFTVLDFGDAYERMGPMAFARYRDLEEKRAKEKYVALLKEVEALRGNKDAMTREQRRVYDLFDDIDADNRFRRGADTVRSQRGLRERTEQALDISWRYLPTMEETFDKYDLPLALTRLPLVESSFNVEAYSRVGAAGLWQFIPSSARIYMRLNEVVDDRRDPWISTDAAARHLQDDYEALGDWPLAITAYNYGRGGIARALNTVGGNDLMDLIERFQSDRFGFASKNYYAEFLGALEVDREYRRRNSRSSDDALAFDTVETQHYVPYETLRRLSGADEALFRKLNPAYRPEVVEGRMYVPPKHLLRIPAGKARSFEIAYENLSSNEKFDSQRMYYMMHRVSRGDSLGKIARTYRTTVASIVAANGIDTRRHLRVGHVIKIPPRAEARTSAPERTPSAAPTRTPRSEGRTENATGAARIHTVKAGQTLGGIARQYRVSLVALRGANNLSADATIRPGMKLRIPAS